MNRITKFTIYCVLFAIVLIGGWQAFRSSSHSTEEAKNIFGSAIYPQYRLMMRFFTLNHPVYKQVKNSPSTPYNIKVKALLEEIEKMPRQSQEQRASHESFTHKLREVLSFTQQRDHEEQDARRFFEDLMHWLFLGVDLKPQMQSFLYHYVELPHHDFFAYLQNMQKKLHDQPRFNGIEHLSSYEDQFLQGNLPSFVALINSQTKLIRIGQPIYQSSHFLPAWFSLQVSPEFLFFLQRQPSHLYVNLMKRQGMEAPLTRSLEALENQCENLYFVTLDKNSSFYRQDKEEYPDQWESISFKEAFLNHMYSGNYFWSKHLKLPIWREELREIVNQVHQSLFQNADTLDRRERQDLIEITYLEILNHLVDKWHPSSMNITCRQGMDRGPSLMVLWMLQKGIMSKSEIAALLLAPPLMLHNRASHASKVERLISAAQRFEQAQSRDL